MKLISSFLLVFPLIDSASSSSYLVRILSSGGSASQSESGNTGGVGSAAGTGTDSGSGTAASSGVGSGNGDASSSLAGSGNSHVPSSAGEHNLPPDASDKAGAFMQDHKYEAGDAASQTAQSYLPEMPDMNSIIRSRIPNFEFSSPNLRGVQWPSVSDVENPFESFDANLLINHEKLGCGASCRQTVLDFCKLICWALMFLGALVVAFVWYISK